MPEEKPKLEIINNRGEETESLDERAYQELVEQSKRRHPSALPHLADVENISQETDE